MYTIYSTIALSLVLCIAYGIRLWTIGKLSLSWLSTSVVLNTVLVFIGSNVGIYLSTYVPYKEVTYGPIPLAAARTSDGVKGAFTRGSGNNGTQAVYQVLLKDNNGTPSLYTITVDNPVEIFEDSPSEQEGTWTIVKREKDWTAPVAKWALGRSVDQSVIIKQELHVPKGSIVQSFSQQ